MRERVKFNAAVIPGTKRMSYGLYSPGVFKQELQRFYFNYVKNKSENKEASLAGLAFLNLW